MQLFLHVSSKTNLHPSAAAAVPSATPTGTMIVEVNAVKISMAAPPATKPAPAAAEQTHAPPLHRYLQLTFFSPIPWPLASSEQMLKSTGIFDGFPRASRVRPMAALSSRLAIRASSLRMYRSSVSRANSSAPSYPGLREVIASPRDPRPKSPSGAMSSPKATDTKVNVVSIVVREDWGRKFFQ